MSNQDHYSTLGVLPDAKDMVINAAYRALAQRYNPDKWKGEPAESHRRMSSINVAYHTLGDEKPRADYDRSRTQKSQQEFSSEETPDYSEAPPCAMSTDLYRIIEQEAHVVRSCLCTGLTELRNANLNEKGRYYSAFFQLAIGIERLAKLALILDHMAQKSLQAPGHQVVKAYGHDLHTLITKVEATARARGYAVSSNFPQSPLCKSVQAFLSEFATGMRYANLDALASGSARRNPLREWNAILQSAVTESVRKTTQERVATRSATISQALRGGIAVIASDLAGNPLTLSTALSEPALIDSASKYLVWELITLLVPLRDVVVEAGYATDTVAVSGSRSETRVPNLKEFFEFLQADREYVMRKKRWP